MNISLTPELESYVAKQVSSGLYTSASEVMRQALRLLIERDAERQAKLTALRAAIQEGDESGAAESWDVEQFLAEQR